jgi:hypothetical protein
LAGVVRGKFPNEKQATKLMRYVLALPQGVSGFLDWLGDGKRQIVQVAYERVDMFSPFDSFCVHICTEKEI